MVSRPDIKKSVMGSWLKTAQNNEQSLNTFDISKVKSTVTNPSTKYKWISVEDEAKIDRIVSEKLPNWSWLEKSDMSQWLYSVALNEQKKKDIQAGRDNLIMELQYKADNANKKTPYTTQIKRARLADLIRDTLWDVPMWVTDNAVIEGFLAENPQYQDEFNKFYYDNRNSTKLWKDLWWIEQTWWDKTWGKVWDIAEWMVGWADKRWEWVKDWLDLTLAWSDQYGPDRQKDLNQVAFWNYVQDKYWTYPWNLTEGDYWQAMKDFNASKEENKKAYTPTVASAATKSAEWLLDIATTATWPWALVKLWFSIAWNVPYWEDVVWVIWDWIAGLGWLVNKVPWLSDIRDSLQTEEEKRDFDMLAWWWLISKMIKWTKAAKNKKYITKDVATDALKELKRWWEEAIKDLSKWLDVENFSSAFYDLWAGRKLAWQTMKNAVVEWKRQKIQTLKDKQAQAISQWDIRTRAWEGAELDILESQWELKWTKTPEQLRSKINKTVNSLRKAQDDAAAQDTKKYWEKELTKMKPQEQPDWTTKDVPTYPVRDAIKELIEYYKNVDTVEAWSYEKLLDAYENWNISLKNILKVKRAMNRVHNKEFGEWKIIKDTQAAAKFGREMEAINDLVEWMEMWEDIRAADSRLSNAYILQDNLDTLISDAADVEKKMSRWLWAKAWRTLARWANKVSFWFNNFISKLVASYLQASIDTSGRMTSLEIYNNMENMIKEYRWLIKKMKNAGKEWINYETLSKDIWAFADQIWVNLDEEED